MPVADQGPLSALPLADYRPYCRLRLPQTTVTHASVPAVDALQQVYADNAEALIPGLDSP